MKHFVSVMGNDCTNGGVTSGHDHVFAIPLEEWQTPTGPCATPGEVPEPWKQSRDLPCLALVTNEGQTGHLVIAKQTREIQRVKAVPVIGGNPTTGMFGGHYLSTSDGRWPYENPIPVFDRFE